MRVDVGGVMPAGLEHVDPEAVERQPATAEIEIERARETGDMRDRSAGPASAITGGAPRQVVERGIGRIAAIAVLAAPLLAGAILGCDHQAGGLEVVDECARPAPELGAENAGDEEGIEAGHGVEWRQVPPGVAQPTFAVFWSKNLFGFRNIDSTRQPFGE